MPEPIQSNANSSSYGPSLTDSCDPTVASCGPPPAASPNVVTIEPVVVEGDAGRQALLQQYDADRCRNLGGEAVFACAATPFVALAGGASASTGVGFAAGVAMTVYAAEECARLISAYDDCVEQNRSYREAAAGCEAKDGVPYTSANPNEIICEVPR